jgi:hypothetical protein
MVFGFEPHPGSVANIYMGDIKLRHPSHAVGGKPLDKKHIDSGRMHIFNVALGNVENVETMNLYMNSKDCGTSSLFTHDEKFLGPIEQVLPVPVYSLKMFFDTFPWNKFEYIDYIVYTHRQGHKETLSMKESKPHSINKIKEIFKQEMDKQ